MTWMFFSVVFFSLESTKPLVSFPFQFKSSQVTCSYHPVTFALLSWCMLRERSISAVVITGLLRDYTIFQSHWGLMLLILLRIPSHFFPIKTLNLIAAEWVDNVFNDLSHHSTVMKSWSFPSFVVTCISTQHAQSYSFTKRISSI